MQILKNETEYAAEFVDALHREGCIIDQERCRELSRYIWLSTPDKKAICAATSLLAPGVIDKSMHAEVFSLLFYHFRGVVSPAAAAKIFRLVWSRYGIYTDDDDSINDVRETIIWLREKAPTILMTHKERKLLAGLPVNVPVFRGEPVWKEIDLGITGMSWTHSRAVADSFTYSDNQENGWLISGYIIASNVLAIFIDRDEGEIILDPRQISLSNIIRGTADHFPKEYL